MHENDAERPQLTGILLAAGRGRRMGTAKQLLPWPVGGGETPLVAAAFDAVAGACDEMVVVLGHEAEAVSRALGARPFHAVESDADAEMFQSVRIGLEAARRFAPAADVLLQPADHPGVASATLNLLIETFSRLRNRAVMPEHGGRGGHPVLIPSAFIDDLLAYSGASGLRQYWADHPEACRRVPVSDPSVVRDVDTPGDYESETEPSR